MKKLILSLIIVLMSIASSHSQIIYTFAPKSPVYENDLLLGSDSVTLATANFTVGSIGEKTMELFGDSKVLIIPAENDDFEPFYTIVNAMDTFRVDFDEVPVFDITIVNVSGFKELQILTSGKGLYGKAADGGRQITADDLFKVYPSMYEENLFSLNYYSWVGEGYDTFATILSNIEDRALNKADAQDIAGKKTIKTAVPVIGFDDNINTVDLTIDPTASTAQLGSQYILKQDNITAGANVVITPTATGVAVSATGGGGSGDETSVGIVNNYANLGIAPGQFQSDVNTAVNTSFGNTINTTGSQTKQGILTLKNNGGGGAVMLSIEADATALSDPGIEFRDLRSGTEFGALMCDVTGDGQLYFDKFFVSPPEDKTRYLLDYFTGLSRTNTDTYTPTADYHPSTKKYVDDAIMTASADESTVGILNNYANLGITIGQFQDDVNSAVNTNIGTLQTDKAEAGNVLELNNTTVFTPDADYEPATKIYADTRVLSGIEVIGNVAGTLTTTITMPENLGSTGYVVAASILSLGTPAFDNDVTGFVILNKTNTTFDVFFEDSGTSAQDVNLMWLVIRP